MRGIDVSNWQQGLNLANLNGIDFIICKATEGIGYTDPACDDFVEQAKANGLLWGFYHFARENEPEQEAEWFYNETSNYFKHGIPVLDYETSNYNNAEWCERFINRLHELTGVWAMLYISASRCGEYEDSWIPETCSLWLAGYPMNYDSWLENESIPYNYYPFIHPAIWQFTSNLYLDGWNGRLDGNIAYLDIDGWNRIACTNSSSNKVQPVLNYVDLAREIVLGEWGNGEDRHRMLENAGYDYQTAQDVVNQYYELAQQVCDGVWGNGWNRKTALEGAGYDYELVQLIVDKMYMESIDYNGC